MRLVLWLCLEKQRKRNQGERDDEMHLALVLLCWERPGFWPADISSLRKEKKKEEAEIHLYWLTVFCIHWFQFWALEWSTHKQKLSKHIKTTGFYCQSDVDVCVCVFVCVRPLPLYCCTWQKVKWFGFFTLICIRSCLLPLPTTKYLA